MVPSSRRQFLTLCTGGFTAAVAGCLGDDSESRPEPTPESEPDRPGPDPGDLVAGLETRHSRLELEMERHESVFEFAAIDVADPRGPRLPYVISDEQANALGIDPEPPDVDDLRTFLDATDYDEETVLVHDRPTSACRKRAVLYVERRGGGGYSTQFCTTTREPSIECDVDETHHQITLIRLPEGVDRVPSGSGRGGRSRCMLPPGHPAFEVEDE